MELQLHYATYLRKYDHKTQALFHALKDSIVNGRIAGGSKLPSSRELAAQYDLSRGTVNVAYEMLNAQGYVRSETGRGTFVVYLGHPSGDSDESDRPAPAAISAWGRRVNEAALIRSRRPFMDTAYSASLSEDLIDFSLGKVDLSHFPSKAWNRYMYAQVRMMYGAQLEDAYLTEGHPALRDSIAHHLRRTRGLAALPEQIVIVNGSLQALMLLVQLLIDPGDKVITENPMYPGTRRAVESVGGIIHGCPVDLEGMRLDAELPPAKLAIVTPGRQFPTGATMSMERRLALLDWAERSGAWIIEDDYDSEYRFRGRPIEPLKAMDRSGRVTFVGTFSRTMLQDIRIGYAVLPPALAELFRKAKQLYEPHPSSILEQRALAAFMGDGHYERHLRRMRRIYHRRFELFNQLLRKQLHPVFDIRESNAGLHIYALWKGSEEELERYKALCAKQHVRLPDTRDTFVRDAVPAVSLGFAHLDEASIVEAVRRLAAAARLLRL